jgi:hypothetical protein
MRLIFKDIEEFKRWIKDNCLPMRYECYITSDNEFILVPIKSTKPIKYAYIKVSNEKIKELEDYIKAFVNNIYRVDMLEWIEDRAIGVEKLMRIEE